MKIEKLFHLLPLMLLIAGNTFFSGCTSNETKTGIPSPQKNNVLKANVLKALDEGKSVFLVKSKLSMLEKQQELSNCQKAITKMNGNAIVVEIDMDDINETNFLSEINIDPSFSMSQPETVVINSQGQITGTLTGIVEIDTLVAMATKKMACCPSGSGKSCEQKK